MKALAPNAILSPGVEIHALSDSYRTMCGASTLWAYQMIRTHEQPTCAACISELARCAQPKAVPA